LIVIPVATIWQLRREKLKFIGALWIIFSNIGTELMGCVPLEVDRNFGSFAARLGWNTGMKGDYI